MEFKGEYHKGGRERQPSVFVMLLDVATGWMMGGCFPALSMNEAHARASKEGWTPSTLSIVANMVRSAARSQWDDSHPLVREAIGLGMAASTMAPTYQHVLLDRGSVVGQWLISVYTTKDGFVAANLSFASSPVDDFMNAVDTKNLIKRSLAEHLAVRSEFGRQLAVRGGVDIAPGLAELML